MAVAELAVRRVLVAYSGQIRQIRAQVHGYVSSSWHGLPDYRTADIEAFAQQVSPIVTGGQRTVASLTDRYLATVAHEITGDPARPVGIPSSLVTDLEIRGVDALDVYRRTGPTVWNALANGRTFPEAVADGLTRALTMSATDLQLAKTITAQHVLGNDDRVVGYQRVPGGSNVCDLCDTASGGRYSSDELLPIHANCSCDVLPIYAGSPAADLPELGTPADEPDRLEPGELPVVHTHGEYRSVLASGRLEYTGPTDF